MKDTPGWASPGSAPSGGEQPDQQGSAEPTDPTGDGQAQPTGQPGADQAQSPTKWSKDQPPPAQWSAPTPQAPGQTAPPPPPVPGWGGHPGPQHPGPGGYGPPGGPGTPGGHPGYGAPGPGYGTPGWGGGWGGPPPAAKPGVIPLRPLGIGEILDGAVSTMRTHWRTVLGISLTVAVVTQIGVILLQGLVLNDAASSDVLADPTATPGEVGRALGDTLLSTSVVMVISVIGTIIATALLTTVTSRAVLGKSVTTAEAWRDARPQLFRLAGLTVLLLLVAGLIMTTGVLPGILLASAGTTAGGVLLAFFGGLGAFVLTVWLMIRFSLASPALMLEKQGVRKSMSRSVKLVRGSWWRVLGIQLLATIIAWIVASIVVIPFSFAGAALDGDGLSGFLATGGTALGWTYLVISGVGAVIGSTLTFPISAGVTVLLYIDQRIRREALDLELGRAAGLQGYGDAQGATPGS
ncbi:MULTISPECIES: glycerophosphoryl diester phosphodiesterase membrane domain-containing protein [Streptomyces]|uniref:Glycerophosphoryl diester phosphodiesterase membrane domain-containing protein n=1 Tax=Streptomyces caniscabiei TaxID=2746961 RepID=A0ABU4N2Q3_9ACTN|nr:MULTISPECIES: glycerophosphoryl diester phosphodiesterase membrane domain-containing protein [Streptomyces]MBE4740262.1 glycerophosphoryl diester phosphodiesterase membrane domain-containing protein [Streptomyces caniscabiei]MBE4759152.1 glycerophosphoryl diester phosphodiesterase membrane domain-containing protein [Streptomyces caniscabiei]MBE4773022.1 glycerophosphoryl diester phosphodiesterase membrane domain-containing protein [Streptomyces caniscabiei]MBE4788090.1 glycerophosphoryl dies